MWNKLKEFVSKIIPLYAIGPAVICVLWNCIVYYGVRLLYGGRTFHDMTTRWDEMIPVIPSTTFVYYVFFPYLVVNIIIIARMDKDMLYRYVITDLIGKTVCLICFLSIPTTNIRPEITGKDISSTLLRYLYVTDAANNLFPSIHCLDSWISSLAIRHTKGMPKSYKVVSTIIAAAICLSTLTTKQHVIADLISGIALAEVSFFFAKKIYQKREIKEALN